MRQLLGSLLLMGSLASGQEPDVGTPQAAVDNPTSTSTDGGLTAPEPRVGDVTDLSLDDLLNTPVVVATRSARKASEVPGVVTALNREEILASGANDLMQVLELIPGFSFHTDVVGVVGVGFRGLWGHEGKVLLLIDGIEMNELLYSTTEFGNHYPVHIIERVEVIRGPGSAVYGGNAELAVINVITRGAKDLMGVEVAGRYSQTARTYMDRSLGISGGWAFESGLEVVVNATTGQGHRGDGTYTDFAGAQFSQATQNLDPLLVTFGLKYKGLTFRLLYDDYRMGARDGYGFVVPDATLPQRFRTLAADVRYRFDLGDHVSVTPYANWNYQVPWETPDPNSSLYYTKSAQRLRGGVLLEVNPLDSLHLLLGVEGYGDMAWLNDTNLAGAQTDFGDKTQVSYANVAAYGQILWDTPIVDIAVGGRYEWNSQVGSNFAPRIALVKSIDRFHVKALYSGAFRSPGIENFNLNPNLHAEHVQVAEGEVGLQMNDILFASVNAFYMRLENPIVYGVDPATLAQTYINDLPVATAGYELDAQLRGRFGFLRATYSLALPAQNDASTYQVPGHPESALGFAAHKVTASGKFRIWRGLALGGRAVFFSERWGYLTPSGQTDDDGTALGQLGLQPATLNMNLWVGYENLGLQGLNLQLGVDNLFNAPIAFLQPYDGGHAPLYSGSRAGYLRLSYAWRPGR